VFGPEGTLQNVAVISSMQKTPVVGACVGATCAAAGDAAESSAAINTSFLIYGTRFDL
jgi:hypothetical protein